MEPYKLLEQFQNNALKTGFEPLDLALFAAVLYLLIYWEQVNLNFSTLTSLPFLPFRGITGVARLVVNTGQQTGKFRNTVRLSLWSSCNFHPARICSI